MNLFFQIESLQLSICSMDDEEFVANFYYVFYVFFYNVINNIIKVNHLLYCYISSFSLTGTLLVSYAYVSIESINCILLSSFELEVILLISSVKTLHLSILNLCCIFLIDLLFFKNCL